MSNQGYKLYVGRTNPALCTNFYCRMPRFESFDFSKEGDRKKFNNLPENQKEAHIDAAQQEALRTNESLDRFEPEPHEFGAIA